MKSKTKILVVEDNELIAFSTKLVLIRIGYDVLPVATSGETARNIVKDAKPDIVLMDINIHGPQDGIEVAGEIQKKQHIPIVFYSANSDEETLDRALKVPYSAFLIKPATYDMLKITIGEMLAINCHEH